MLRPTRDRLESTSRVSRRACGSGTGRRSAASAAVLAEAGYTGVQVAPPQNSVKRTELGNGSDTILHPWWEVYQPVTLRADEPDGQRRSIQGDGHEVPQGWGQGLCRRSDQPHDRSGQHLLRRSRLHAVPLPATTDPTTSTSTLVSARRATAASRTSTTSSRSSSATWSDLKICGPRRTRSKTRLLPT